MTQEKLRKRHRRFFRTILTFALLGFLARPAMAQDQYWQTVGRMPIPVKGAQAIVKDSLIYVIGGYSDSTYRAINRIQIYNPRTNQWKVAADTLMVERYGLVAKNYRSTAIIFGGTTVNDSSLEMWDYRGSTYYYGFGPHFDRQFATAQVLGNYLYVFGGYSENNATVFPYLIAYYIPGASVVYQRNTSVIPDSSQPLGQDIIQQMSATVGNTVFVMGGVLNGVLKTIYRFETESFTWLKSDVSLIEERAAGAAVAVSDRAIYVIGGYNESQAALSSVECVFIENEQVAFSYPIGALNIARSELTAALLDSVIYVFGGQDVFGHCVPEVEKLVLQSQATPVSAPVARLPRKMQLFGNFPNPFNSSTKISFLNPKTQPVRVEIFTITGQKVETVLNKVLAPGQYRLTWNGTDRRGNALSSGIYFYRLTWPEGTITRSMILLR